MTAWLKRLLRAAGRKLHLNRRRGSPLGYCRLCRRKIYTSFTLHYDVCPQYDRWLTRGGRRDNA